MHGSGPKDPVSPEPSSETLRRAIRELHAPSLHGFALLLTLGDRRRALTLTADALAAADIHVAQLRHPERAAAWLRSRLTAAAGRRDSRIDAVARLDALEPLGVSMDVLTGLASLGVLERAALIGSAIERLDDRDVGTIVGRSGSRLQALLHRARQAFLDACATAPDGSSGPGGPLTELVRSTAARAMA